MVVAVTMMLLLMGALGAHPVLYHPYTRVMMGGDPMGVAEGVGACGDGTDSSWLTTTSGSKKMSEYGTHYLTLQPRSKITLYYLLDEIAPAVHQLQYCRVSDEVMEPQLAESCFEALKRSPDDVFETPYVAESPTLDFVMENACLKAHVNHNRPMRSVWLAPETIKPGELIVLRWVVQRYGACCPSPTVCGSTIPQALLDWEYTDPLVLTQKCKVFVDTDPDSVCDCPFAANCGEDNAQVKTCIDAIDVRRYQDSLSGEADAPITETLRGRLESDTTTESEDTAFIRYSYSGTPFEYLNRTFYWSTHVREGDSGYPCNSFIECREPCEALFAHLDYHTTLDVANYCADIGEPSLYFCLESYLSGAC